MARSNSTPAEIIEIDMTGDDDDELNRAIILSLLEQRSQDTSLVAKNVVQRPFILNDSEESFEAAIAASLDTALEERSHRKHRLSAGCPPSSRPSNSPTSHHSSFTRRLDAGTPKSSPQHEHEADAENDNGRPCLSKRLCVDHQTPSRMQQQVFPPDAPAYESEESALSVSMVDRHAAPSPGEQAQEPVPCTSGQGQGWAGSDMQPEPQLASTEPAMHLRRFYRRQRVLWRCNGEVYEAVVSDIDSRSCPLLYTLNVISPDAPNKRVETTAHELLLYLEPREKVWCRLRAPADDVEGGEGAEDVLDMAAAEAVMAGSAQPHAAAPARMCVWEEAEVLSTDLSDPDPLVCVMTVTALDLTPWHGRLPPEVQFADEDCGDILMLEVRMSDIELYHGVGESSSSTQCLPVTAGLRASG